MYTDLQSVAKWLIYKQYALRLRRDEAETKQECCEALVHGHWCDSESSGHSLLSLPAAANREIGKMVQPTQRNLRIDRRGSQTGDLSRSKVSVHLFDKAMNDVVVIRTKKRSSALHS